MSYFSRRAENVKYSSDVDMEKTVKLYMEQLESKAFIRTLNDDKNTQKTEFMYRIPIDRLRIENLDFVIEETSKLLVDVKSKKGILATESDEEFAQVNENQRLMPNFWDCSEIFGETGQYKRLLILKNNNHISVLKK